MPEKQPRGRPPISPQDLIGDLIREGHSRRSAYNHAYCSIALAALADGLAKGGGLKWRYPELTYYAKPRFKVTLLAEIGRLIVGGGLCGEGLRLGECRQLGEEPQVAGLESGFESLDKEPAEQPREPPHGQEETRSAGDPMSTVGA